MSPLQLMERGQWVGKIQQLLIARSKERIAIAKEQALRKALK